jgi:hypothetical protein
LQQRLEVELEVYLRNELVGFTLRLVGGGREVHQNVSIVGLFEGLGLHMT